MGNNEKFCQQLTIFQNTVTACLDVMIVEYILKNENVVDIVEKQFKFSNPHFSSIILRQKLIFIQYLFTIFDPSGFHLEKFLNENMQQFKKANVIDYTQTVLKMFHGINKDVTIVRNNISSHSSYNEKGHKKGYESLAKIDNSELDIILCFLRLISVNFRNAYNVTQTYIKQEVNREALILEEIRRKIEYSFTMKKVKVLYEDILVDIIRILVSKYYSKGIQPYYDIKTGLAYFMN